METRLRIHECGRNISLLTPRITGGKKQSDEGTALFAVRVQAIVR